MSWINREEASGQFACRELRAILFPSSTSWDGEVAHFYHFPPSQILFGTERVFGSFASNRLQQQNIASFFMFSKHCFFALLSSLVQLETKEKWDCFCNTIRKIHQREWAGSKRGKASGQFACRERRAIFSANLFAVDKNI